MSLFLFVAHNTLLNITFLNKLTFALVDIGMRPSPYVHVLSKIRMNILPRKDVQIYRKYRKYARYGKTSHRG